MKSKILTTRRLSALAVALAMVFGLFLTACNSPAPAPAVTTAATTAATTATPAETTAATEAPTEAATEAPTTEAATEAPTTAAPTTAEPTTAAPAAETIEEHEEVKADTAVKSGDDFPMAVSNDAPALEGGILKYGQAADSGFAGILNPCFYEDAYDAEVMGFFSESLILFDDNFVADQHGAATYTYDIDAKTLTLTVRDGVKWQDGEPVTADDLVYTYEVIAHPESESFRYDEDVQNVEGVLEYHAGEADTISGLELSEDKMSVTIHFVEFYPSILVGGFWTTPIPRHYYEGISVKDMPGHEKTRLTPIGFGPFKLKSIVPGESVEYERFDDYWAGRPILDGVHFEVINPELVPTAMENGLLDICEFSTMFYPDYPNPTNYEYLGQLQTVFSYTGFKLGKWDEDGGGGTGTNVVDPAAKMINKNLRQAIGYAVDIDTIGATIYNGLRFRATTPITPRHAGYQDKTLKGYFYDPDKAKELLDEAGYIDIDGDGFREDPEGNQFTIFWASMEGPGADTIAQFKIQCWADVGLRVELYNGRLMEFNAFYDAVEYDEEGIDMYDGAWQTGFNPSPSVLWGYDSPANYSRYYTDDLAQIMDDINSVQAWDQDYLTERYKTWQKMFLEDPPAIATLWRISLEAVNNRVKNYTVKESDIELKWHLVSLTADEPFKK